MSFVILTKWILSYTCISSCTLTKPCWFSLHEFRKCNRWMSDQSFQLLTLSSWRQQVFVTCPTLMTDDRVQKKKEVVLYHPLSELWISFLLHRQRSFIRLSNENNFLSGYLTGRTAFKIELTCSTKQQLESLHGAKMPWHWCGWLAGERLKAYFTLCIVGRGQISSSCGI